MISLPKRGEGYLSDGTVVLECLRLGGAGVWRWQVEANVLQWTEELERVHGLAPGQLTGTMRSFLQVLHADDARQVWRTIRRCLESGEPYRVTYRTAGRSGAEPRWIEATGGLVTEPDGTRSLTGICRDITARMENELELERRLHQQQAVARLGSFALSEPDFQTILDRAVEIAAEVLDVPLTDVLQFANAADRLELRAGIGWMPGLVGAATVGTELASQAGYTLASSGPVVVRDLLTETRFRAPRLLRDHGVRSGMSVIIHGTGERPFGVFGAHTPIPRRFDARDVDFLVSLANIVANSARAHAAAAQGTLLVREMAHRAGNMLQLVSTLASQTFGGDADPDEARRAFSARLGALARSNYLIAKAGWTETRLCALLGEVLQPFLGRIDFEGRDILLPPDFCFDLGLIVHELATNSIKYGSLGREDGRIALGWSLFRGAEGETGFRFTWRDLAGPLAAPAGGRGFGSKLMQALIERKRAGRIETAAEQGYSFAFSVPRVE